MLILHARHCCRLVKPNGVFGKERGARCVAVKVVGPNELALFCFSGRIQPRRKDYATSFVFVPGWALWSSVCAAISLTCFDTGRGDKMYMNLIWPSILRTLIRKPSWVKRTVRTSFTSPLEVSAILFLTTTTCGFSYVDESVDGLLSK